MTRLLALFALAISALALPGHAAAQEEMTARTIVTERWVEEWDPASRRWVRVADSPEAALANGAQIIPAHSVLPVTAPATPLAQYGPFRVLNGTRAAVTGSTGIS